MERNYIAFISYRHLPLDAGVAKMMHRRIEHYVVPRSLRKNGTKKLGYVFRDEDELPTSSDLSSNIRTALDHSEFLIVICTPETAKSRWVQTEIRYFLEHHDRNHVLAVLAAGDPEESFPPELTEVRGAGGDLLERIEPLAANLCTDSPFGRNRSFAVESLRILAPLIGCSFDELYRREQRYKLRRIGVAAGAAAVIAAAFIGILLNRNAEIRANYEQALRNQSAYLATESLNALEAGDRLSAIGLAIEALPSAGRERPLVSRAEYALGCAVNAYTAPGNSDWTASGALSHSNPVEEICLNKGGTILCSRTMTNVITGWDTERLQKLWELPLEAASYSRYAGIAGFFGEDRLLAWSGDCVCCVDCGSGDLLWKYSADQLCTVSWGSVQNVLLAEETQEAVVLTSDTITRLSANGVMIAAFPAPEITVDGQEATFSLYSHTQLSADGTLLAFIFSYGSYDESFGGVAVVDLRDGSLRTLYGGIAREDYYLLPAFVFPDASHLVFSTMENSDESFILANASRFCRTAAHLNCLDLDTNEIVWETVHPYAYPTEEDRLTLDDSASGELRLVYTYSNYLAIVDPKKGETLGAAEFLAPVVGVDVSDDGVRCVLADGSVGIVYPDAMDRWDTLKLFASDLEQGVFTAGSAYWILQRNSKDVILYDIGTRDKSWTPGQIEWASEEDAQSFYVDDSFLDDGCFALFDDNMLLLSDGNPGSALRELRLPADPDRYWYTKYYPVGCRDGVFTLFYTGLDDGCGLIDVDIASMTYEQRPWNNDPLDLLWIFTFKPDASAFYSIVCEHTGEEGKPDVQVLSACVLDEKLQIVKQLPIGSFTGLSEVQTTTNDVGKAFLYLPDTGEAFQIDYFKGSVKACGVQLTGLFDRLAASGADLDEAICWSQDGTKFAAFTAENRLELYRGDGSFIAAVTGETTEILSARFTPDGSQLLTVENDKYLRRYMAEDGSLLGRAFLYVSSYYFRADVEWEFTSNGFLSIKLEDTLNLVSMEDWGVFAYVPYCYGYLEEQDVFFCRSYEGLDLRVGAFPRYSTEELIGRGKEVLNGWELSENQRLEYGLSDSAALPG